MIVKVTAGEAVVIPGGAIVPTKVTVPVQVRIVGTVGTEVSVEVAAGDGVQDRVQDKAQDRVQDKAQDKVKAAMELEPNNYRVLSANAYIAAQKKEYDTAEELYQTAFSNGGQTNPEVLEDYGDFLLAQGKEALANEYWLKAQAAGGKSTRLNNKITNKGL